MSLGKLLVSVGALSTLLAVAPVARAQGCKTAADCGKGFTCELVTASPPPTTTPACKAGTVCPVADPAPADAPDQAAAVSGTCVEAPCATDADCGPTMVCHTEMIGECSGGSACPANAECLAPSTPPTCTTRSVSTCEYKWQVACKADADCGDGFSVHVRRQHRLFGRRQRCSGAAGGATTPVAGSGIGLERLGEPEQPRAFRRQLHDDDEHDRRLHAEGDELRRRHRLPRGVDLRRSPDARHAAAGPGRRRRRARADRRAGLDRAGRARSLRLDEHASRPDQAVRVALRDLRQRGRRRERRAG